MSNVEMSTPIDLICKVLFPSLSTFDTPPDRNTNTGNAIAEDAGFKPAMQTILHNAQYPSHITLPIVLR